MEMRVKDVMNQMLKEIEPISLQENWKHYEEYLWSTAPNLYCPVCRDECFFYNGDHYEYYF